MKRTEEVGGNFNLSKERHDVYFIYTIKIEKNYEKQQQQQQQQYHYSTLVGFEKEKTNTKFWYVKSRWGRGETKKN